MAPPSSLVSKLKVQLKLSIARLRMTQQKDEALAKQQRRAMAQLLETNKVESARIRVENIIRSDITTELHEILELYCELLLARSQLLEPPQSPGQSPSPHPAPDPGLEEAIRSVIHAAPRTEVKELHTVRNLLVEKFGKDFALSALEGEGVAPRVLERLKIESPKRELVDAYLAEIAKTYQIDWPPGSHAAKEAEEEEEEDENGEDDDSPSGGQKVKATEEPLAAKPSEEKKPEAPKPKPKPKPKESSGKGGPGGNVPDADDLSARFAALLRK